MLFVPARTLPTVTTTGSPGRVSRDTTVCNRTTIIAANTTGSTEAWGIEPCAPRPCTVIRTLSAADRTGPALVPTRPAGAGKTCCAMATSTAGTTLFRWSSTMPFAPSPVSSAGWNSNTNVPAQCSRPSAIRLSRPEQARDVHVVAAGVHDRHRVAVRVRRDDLARIRQPCRLLDRKRIHVGPKEHRRAFTVAQHTNDSGSPEVCTHFVAVIAEPRRHLRRRHGLLMGELGMGVQLPVEILLPFTHPGKPAKDCQVGRVRRIWQCAHGSSVSDTPPPVSAPVNRPARARPRTFRRNQVRRRPRASAHSREPVVRNDPCASGESSREQANTVVRFAERVRRGLGIVRTLLGYGGSVER